MNSPTERFSEEQVAAMTAHLDGANVKTRQQSGRTLSYIEGYAAIKEANRVFGFGGWDSITEDTTCIVAATQGEPNYTGRERAGYLIAYTARVRVTVHFPDGSAQSHSDVGYGEGIDYGNVGQAHESAIKEAVTDAEKRALRHWGNVFGLALYDKEQREVDRTGTPQQQPRPAPQQSRPAPQGVKALEQWLLFNQFTAARTDKALARVKQFAAVTSEAEAIQKVWTEAKAVLAQGG